MINCIIGPWGLFMDILVIVMNSVTVMACLKSWDQNHVKCYNLIQQKFWWRLLFSPAFSTPFPTSFSPYFLPLVHTILAAGCLRDPLWLITGSGIRSEQVRKISSIQRRQRYSKKYRHLEEGLNCMDIVDFNLLFLHSDSPLSPSLQSTPCFLCYTQTTWAKSYKVRYR